MGTFSDHSGHQHSQFRKCCCPSVLFCVIRIQMIHLFQKLRGYSKQIGISIPSWRVNGQENMRCDLVPNNYFLPHIHQIHTSQNTSLLKILLLRIKGENTTREQVIDLMSKQNNCLEELIEKNYKFEQKLKNISCHRSILIEII